jgi:diguanylate cyclase (GGDEF)-like protein
MKERPPRRFAVLLAVLWLVLAWSHPALALKPITVDGEQDRIEITSLGEAYEDRGDQLQVDTALGADGTAGRISVRAVTPGTNPNWLAFALHNPTQKTIELWLTADRYNPIGSGIVWPDLDARRIEAVTHSTGFAPDRIRNDRTDIFRLTIERGQTITYVAELSSERFSRLYLWKPIEFEQRQRERQLFNGIMLGIVGLLAVFLTAVFGANHSVLFPSAALVVWCVLAMLCVDFGFWHKLFQMRPEDNAQYRAASEAAFAASLVIFLFAFLRVNLWNGFAQTLFFVWIAGQLAIVATAVLDPRLAATVARMSLAAIGAVGALIVLAQALRGIDRALAIVPTWLLFLVWLFGAGVTLTGRLHGDYAVYGLVAGLVLIMVMIGFTVTQYAFRAGEPLYGTAPAQSQLRLAALDTAGVAVWEWTARRNEIKFDPEVELALGLNTGDLPTRIDDFAGHIHPADRERFLIAIAGLKEASGGTLRTDLRLRHADSSYRWFELDGATLPVNDRRQLRCVGLVRDVTDAKRAQERLLHNAVHDSLTSLPNRELFLDRLGVTLQHSLTEPRLRPAVIFVDLDRFKSVNNALGLVVGDTILRTIARRLARHVQPPSSLGRISGDQFALMVVGNTDPRELVRLADRLRLAIRSPIRMVGQEIVLTGAIGIAVADSPAVEARDLLREAEVAMYRAKRAGSDRIEVFTAEMRGEKDQRIAIEGELRRAIEAKQLRLLYQPIIALSNEELVGFEALVRWQHPRLGLLSPADFIPAAEDSDLIVQLGTYVLAEAVSDLARWQKELPRPDNPLFVSVNISSRQLIMPDLVNQIRHLLGRAVLASNCLRLEITESLVMDNPERASHVLDLLREIGVDVALDDFGTGYSSLAYLNRFPVSTIKIDRAIVQAGSEGGSGAVILRSITALAHELDKKIVAEGVESAEDASLLRSIGCHYAQGFHYGEPMPEADVIRLLRLIRKADRRMRRRGLVRGVEKKKPAAEAATSPVSASPTEGQMQGAANPPVVRPPAAYGSEALAGGPSLSPQQFPGPPPGMPVAALPPGQPMAPPVATHQQAPPSGPFPAVQAPPLPPAHPLAIADPAVPPVPPRAQVPPRTPSTIDQVLGRVANGTGEAPPLGPQPAETAAAPPGSRAASRRPIRRINTDALPPAIVERLARLAGHGAMPRQPRPRSAAPVQSPDGAVLPGSSGKNAAE